MVAKVLAVTEHAHNRRTVQKNGVDLVGPISPPSDGSHRYILKFFDYATKSLKPSLSRKRYQDGQQRLSSTVTEYLRKYLET